MIYKVNRTGKLVGNMGLSKKKRDVAVSHS